jgi:hypothetical protein
MTWLTVGFAIIALSLLSFIALKVVQIARRIEVLRVDAVEWWNRPVAVSDIFRDSEPKKG